MGSAERTRKHRNDNNDNLVFLTPMVNSCKLLPKTGKLLPGRGQRMVAYHDYLKDTGLNPKARNSLYPDYYSYSHREPSLSAAPYSLPSVPFTPNEVRNRPTRSAPHPKSTGGNGAYHFNATSGFPIIHFHLDDAGSSLHRIDLDRRCLDECPQFGALEDLQVLNLQHNMIATISQLSLLRQLVILNLDDNHVTDMSGIQALTSLRILNLANNRICQITCLDNLSKLHILDLHHNQISKMENLNHLTELQVLNLAGNNISRVENLQGLDSLMELNLRHNHISFVDEVERLPRLRRLFLSCNNISSLPQLGCSREPLSLSELTLDGNPVALETWYKQAVLRCVLHLKQLDMKRITDEDRRMAGVQARKEEEKKKESHKQTIHKEKRRLAIRNAAQQWEGVVAACLELPSTCTTTNGAKEEVSPENSPAHCHTQTNGLAQEPSPDEPRRVSPGFGPERMTGGPENRFRTNSRPNSPRDPKPTEAGSVTSLSLSDSHLAELDGDTLRLFGPGALEALERGWGVQTAGAVTVIAFRYIHFDAIVPTLPRIRVKFPNLAHLIFLEANISRLPQLAALAQVRRLDQLTIHPQGNPVVGLALWRSFVIYRLHHFNLQKINGQEVTMNDVIAAERVFGTLGHVAATETPRCRLLLLLEESRKRQLQFLLEGRGRRAGLSPEELRDNGKLAGEGLSRALFNYPSRDGSTDSPEEGAAEVSERAATVDLYLQDLVRQASETNVKGEALHRLWPNMFAEMVRDCVLEMRDREAFRQASLAKLSK
ncbi:leucine-rich repeat-containing protein 49 isoform X1 [Syngnathus scovelli]|uniref:leucine-rich repeat-containing protein 49 isoform X1 n=1 Tax=Syngnathus scovelli TaxID=161590 RepID=UPI002110507E|nr:leucine-rich repeat-containing protein 49 isoform X1 [Syngnathus scovelli]XP_049574990.1 leucine-rich repeat-containing protein 49 isoform X1 [Syngnathus scovelli]